MLYLSVPQEKLEQRSSIFTFMARMRVKGLIPTSYSTCVNLAMLYSTAEMYSQWKTISQCHCPLHLWLVGLYLCIHSVQFVSQIGHCSVAKTPGAECMRWYTHRSTPAAQIAFSIITLVILPFSACWAILGARWFAVVLEESPDCFPAGAHLSATFFIICIAAALVLTPLCSMFAFHAWKVGGSLERGRASLNAIQDEDMLHRWGQPTPLLDIDLQGMSADHIAALPCEVAGARSRKSSGNCPICLEAFLPGEKIRRLPGCQHEFHRPCVDLWLLRNHKCPMCKLAVRPETTSERV